MSRQFDAKQYALKCRTKSEGVELFLSYLDISADDFKDCEGMSAEEYIYGAEQPVTDHRQDDRDENYVKFGLRDEDLP